MCRRGWQGIWIPRERCSLSNTDHAGRSRMAALLLSLLRGFENIWTYLDPGPKGPLADLRSLVLVDFLADEIDEFFG